MALNLPKQLASLIVQDTAIQRAFSNVRAAVDPLLQFVNGYFSTTATGLAIQGPVTVNGNETVTGTLSAGATSLGALTATNITATGTITAPTVTAGNGVICLGYQQINQSAFTAGTVGGAVAQYASNGHWQAAVPYATSVAAVMFYCVNTAISAGQVQLFINISGGATLPGSTILTPGLTISTQTFARGAYPVAAAGSLLATYNANGSYAAGAGYFSYAVWVYQ